MPPKQALCLPRHEVCSISPSLKEVWKLIKQEFFLKVWSSFCGKGMNLKYPRGWVWSLASISGLRIQRCPELCCRSQMCLGSGVAVAVAQACGCSSDSTPSLGTSICHGYSPETHTKFFLGVPIMAQQKRIWLGMMRLRVQSLASLSGLGIQHCHELWCRSQTRHRLAAMAPTGPLAWEPPYAMGVALKKQKEFFLIKNKSRRGIFKEWSLLVKDPSWDVRLLCESRGHSSVSQYQSNVVVLLYTRVTFFPDLAAHLSHIHQEESNAIPISYWGGKMWWWSCCGWGDTMEGTGKYVEAVSGEGWTKVTLVCASKCWWELKRWTQHQPTLYTARSSLSPSNWDTAPLSPSNCGTAHFSEEHTP